MNAVAEYTAHPRRENFEENEEKKKIIKKIN